jgi:hypothetical protein
MLFHVVTGHRVEALLEKGEQSLRYLKVLVPKRAADVNPGSRKFVVREGSVVEGNAEAVGPAAPHSNWTGNNVDPDSLARHNAQLKRMNFLDRGVAPPRGPTWLPGGGS